MTNKYFLAFALLLTTLQIHAAEGGSSSYFQGSYGDFATGMLGAEGFYARNDVIYYDASIPYDSLGRPVNGYVTQSVWGDLIKFAYISDARFLGGRYNAALMVPVLFTSQVTRHVEGRAPTVASTGDVSGVGDLYLTPAALGWNWNFHHVNANLSFVAPTGEFDEARALNEGRNYWSFDPNVSYTWLHPHRGHEFTATIGYMVNATNRDTHYRTGDELHLDWTLAQHFSEQLGVGLTGYWYQQTTEDSGELPSGYLARDFDAHGLGVGIALLVTPRMMGRDVSLIAKWITDRHADRRLDGDVYMLSFGMKL